MIERAESPRQGGACRLNSCLGARLGALAARVRGHLQSGDRLADVHPEFVLGRVRGLLHPEAPGLGSRGHCAGPFGLAALGPRGDTAARRLDGASLADYTDPLNGVPR